MKRFLLTMAKPLIKRLLKRELEDSNNRSVIIKIVNDKVDVPKLTEDEEGRMLTQVYDAVAEALEIFVDRM